MFDFAVAGLAREYSAKPGERGLDLAAAKRERFDKLIERDAGAAQS